MAHWNAYKTGPLLLLVLVLSAIGNDNARESAIQVLKASVENRKQPTRRVELPGQTLYGEKGDPEGNFLLLQIYREEELAVL